MTGNQLEELVQFIGHWLYCEKMLMPREVKFHHIVAIYEPLRRYFTSRGYSLEPEVTSPLERKAEKRGQRKLFDFGYYRTKRYIGMIEMKRSTDGAKAILKDIAKLQALGIGQRLLVIVGDKQPTWASNNQFLSFDINQPQQKFKQSAESANNKQWNIYFTEWRNLMNRRITIKNNKLGRGYSPNFKTTFVNSYNNNGIFVALWEIKSPVGGGKRNKTIAK